MWRNRRRSRERRSLEILSVKKEAKLSASELADVKAGKVVKQPLQYYDSNN